MKDVNADYLFPIHAFPQIGKQITGQNGRFRYWLTDDPQAPKLSHQIIAAYRLSYVL